MRPVLASAKNAVTAMAVRHSCGIMLLVAILILRIDMVEVWGSSSHGPTMNYRVRAQYVSLDPGGWGRQGRQNGSSSWVRPCSRFEVTTVGRF